jgi:hypothetical protein
MKVKRLPVKEALSEVENLFGMIQVHPVRNSSGALNPAGTIIKPNPAIAGLQSSGALFLTG